MRDNDMFLLLLPVRIEDAVNDWVHTGVRAGEHKENLLYQVTHFTRALLVECVPERRLSNNSGDI